LAGIRADGDDAVQRTSFHTDEHEQPDRSAEASRNEQAEEMYQQTLGLKEMVLGKDHPDTLASMDNLAEVLRFQGRYEQAEDTRVPAQVLTPTLSLNWG
jgi:Tetratricopeptide repeat